MSLFYFVENELSNLFHFFYFFSATSYIKCILLNVISLSQAGHLCRLNRSLIFDQFHVFNKNFMLISKT